jgi:putative transposase
VVNYLGGVYQVSQRRACLVARIPVSTFRYQRSQEARTALRLRIQEIAQARVRYGYRKIRVLLTSGGWNLGKKLVYRLYCEEGLALRYEPGRRRCAAANRRERGKVTAPNQAWSLDFVADQLADGRRIHVLTIVDVCTRESLAIEAGQSLKEADVMRVPNRICAQRGRIMPVCRSTFRGRESRPTTRTWKHSTGPFDRSAWTSIGLQLWRK